MYIFNESELNVGSNRLEYLSSYLDFSANTLMQTDP